MELAQRPQRIGGMAASPGSARRQRPSVARMVIALLLLCAFAGFAALGTWQVQRLQWKTDLIERVNSRVHAAPVPAPGRDQWDAVSRDADEYRHVHVSGQFLHDRSTLVFASTALGTGYWVLTPLRTADNTLILVNRGFVTPEQARILPSAEEESGLAHQTVSLSGLLRLSEPGGGYLRRNDAVAGRWYSRDVQAISQAKNLSSDEVAPYFIDMDGDQAANATATPDVATRQPAPVAGLTVIHFNNNHLVYALTWYALALMTAGIGVWLVRDDRRRRRMAAEQ